MQTAALSRSLVKLGGVEVGIEAALFQQGFMGSLFNDVPVLHNQDEISVFYSGESVSYDKTGTLFGQLVHGSLSYKLRACIHRRSSFIQDEHGLF